MQVAALLEMDFPHEEDDQVTVRKHTAPHERHGGPSCALIIDKVAGAYGFTSEALRRGEKYSKQQDVATARQTAMYLCRVLTRKSYPVIGKAFGMDHTTVIYSMRTVEARRRADRSLRIWLDEFKEHWRSEISTMISNTAPRF